MPMTILSGQRIDLGLIPKARWLIPIYPDSIHLLSGGLATTHNLSSTVGFCGPGYSFGTLGNSETDYPPAAFDGADVEDALDSGCRTHDQCHSECTLMHGQCSEFSESGCKCLCEKRLGKCADKTPPQAARAAVGWFFPSDGSGGPAYPAAPVRQPNPRAGSSAS